tara:strand:+ start:526 stop:1578 length:1053 start_codon:yes stop_codon:yes gene_type:complete
MTTKNKILLTVFSSLFILFLGTIYYDYFNKKIFDTNQEFFVTHNSYEEFFVDLDSMLFANQSSSFINTFVLNFFLNQKRLKYWFEKRVIHGRYLFNTSSTINDVINRLRVGDRDPVNVIFNSANSFEDVFGAVSSQLYVDSVDFINYIDSAEINVDQLCFIPETYNMYWSISVSDFFKKMNNEYDRFWNRERTWAAGKLNLTPFEVVVLASIIEKETQHIAEMSTIAGVYLNRLNGSTKSGKMRLQADPTINYCRVKSGKKRRNRIYIKNINEESACPHNTYHHDGLPPSPICIPSTQAIQAVLNSDKHDFLYFCAKPGWDGQHNFAKNARQHQKNQKKWTKWLNQQGIR